MYILKKDKQQMKVPKVVEPTNKKRIYKTLGTSVIYTPIIPPFLNITWHVKQFFLEKATIIFKANVAEKNCNYFCTLYFLHALLIYGMFLPECWFFHFLTTNFYGINYPIDRILGQQSTIL